LARRTGAYLSSGTGSGEGASQVLSDWNFKTLYDVVAKIFGHQGTWPDNGSVAPIPGVAMVAATTTDSAFLGSRIFATTSYSVLKFQSDSTLDGTFAETRSQMISKRQSAAPTGGRHSTLERGEQWFRRGGGDRHTGIFKMVFSRL